MGALSAMVKRSAPPLPTPQFSRKLGVGPMGAGAGAAAFTTVPLWPCTEQASDK